MRNWRKMTWTLWIWSALILVWAVAGAGSANCGSEKGDAILSAEDAQTACEAGAGIGVAIVLGFGSQVIWAPGVASSVPALSAAPMQSVRTDPARRF